MKIIRFCDRTPSVDRIKVGNEMDNLAESVRFELPEWDGAAVSLYISNGKFSDVILLDADRIYSPTRTHTQHPGRWTAYLEAQQDGDVVWHSDPFGMIVGDLPDTGEQISQAYPNAVEEAMKAAAQTLRDKDAAEAARKAAEDAADAAGNAAGIARGAADNASSAAQGAQQSAAQAETYKNAAGDSAAQAARDAEQTAQDRTAATAAATSAASDAEKTAADREAADAAASAAKQSAEQAATDAAQVAQDKQEVAAKVETEVSALRDAILSGTMENAAYHIGFYRDENGELCELEEGE